MKFVAFLMPDMVWDGDDWLYSLMEICDSNYDFFLVEAKNAEIAKELASNEIWETNLREHGIEMLVDIAYQGFCDLEFEKDEDIIPFLGEKDGKAALKLYEKYGWETFWEDNVSFHKTLTREEREIFYSFDEENIEKLYKLKTKSEILIMKITKELKQRKKK